MWLLVPALLLVLFQEGGPTESGPAAAPVAQPIAFRHKRHSQLGLKCVQCHSEAPAEAAAGFPEMRLCLSCHRGIPAKTSELKKLLGYADQEEDIPWVRVYKLPYYVFFHHGNHARASAECASCHGQVQARDVLWQEGDISMDACIDCHRDRNVSTECHLCHELNQ